MEHAAEGTLRPRLTSTDPTHSLLAAHPPSHTQPHPHLSCLSGRGVAASPSLSISAGPLYGPPLHWDTLTQARLSEIPPHPGVFLGAPFQRAFKGAGDANSWVSYTPNLL